MLHNKKYKNLKTANLKPKMKCQECNISEGPFARNLPTPFCQKCYHELFCLPDDHIWIADHDMWKEENLSGETLTRFKALPEPVQRNLQKPFRGTKLEWYKNHIEICIRNRVTPKDP
jgi:hypothetical protein